MKKILTIVIPVIAVAASVALAQVRYTDGEGVTHWVDSLDQVPEKSRAGAIGREDTRPRQQPWAQSVQDCFLAGQSEDTKFDAYISGPNIVKMLGTSRAQQAFSKCMTQAGHQVR